MKKRIFMGVGLACLTAGTLLAGCGASNSQPTENTTTAIETTTIATEAETTTIIETSATATTEAPTTTTAEAWRSKYEDALIQPKKNPEEVWDGVYKVELRLDNGMHIYLPSFFSSWYDGFKPQGNIGFVIKDTGNPDGYIDYSEYDINTGKSHYGKDFFVLNSNKVNIVIHDSVIDIAGRISSIMPEDDAIHKYKKIGEKSDKVYYIDFMAPYLGEWKVYETEFEDSSNLGYYNKYADMIADTAWVDKNNKSVMYGLTKHPEDDVFMDYLRQYYKTHDTSDGVPSAEGDSHYTRYAIADFDADGENELALQHEASMGGEYTTYYLEIYKVNYCDINNYKGVYASIGGKFNEVIFLDNGVVYNSVSDELKKNAPNIEFLDNKEYQILSDDIYEKLNYALDNLIDPFGRVNHSLVLKYTKENNVITKSLGAQEEVFSVEKTQAEYEADKAILNSGKVMNVEIKDFTAENLRL